MSWLVLGSSQIIVKTFLTSFKQYKFVVFEQILNNILRRGSKYTNNLAALGKIVLGNKYPSPFPHVQCCMHEGLQLKKLTQ